MPLIELKNYLIKDATAWLGPFDLTLSSGDVWRLNANAIESAGLFFRALATLAAPAGGTYQFSGQTLNFSGYRQLLPWKQKISYISPKIALASNRTVQENLLLPRYYRKNALSISLSEEEELLCRLFNITDILTKQLADCNSGDQHAAAVVRELSKSYEVLLVEQPEEMIPPDRLPVFFDILEQASASGKPVVFFPRDRKCMDWKSPTGEINITDNLITIIGK